MVALPGASCFHGRRRLEEMMMDSKQTSEHALPMERLLYEVKRSLSGKTICWSG
jgi:hypothetical protein